MLNISLMTLNMFMFSYLKYKDDGNLKNLELSYEEIMRLAHDGGYQAVDVTSLEVKILTLEKVKKCLNKHNLKVSSYIFFEKFAAMDEEGFEIRISKAKQAVDIAKMLKTNVLMLVPQAHENINKNTPSQIRSQLVKHWIPIAAYAKEKGIHTVVEDTPDLKLQFCRTEELKEVLDRTPNLEMVYDSGNMLLVGEDPVIYYNTFEKQIAHIHLKDMSLADVDEPFADIAANGKKMKAALTGTGMVNLKKLIGQIKRSGYNGYLTIEFVADMRLGVLKSLIRSREYVEQLLN